MSVTMEITGIEETMQKLSHLENALEGSAVAKAVGEEAVGIMKQHFVDERGPDGDWAPPQLPR